MTTDPFADAGTTTDVAAALNYAETHALADTIDLPGDRILVRHRDGENWQALDTHTTARPRRSTGTVHVHDADSFIEAIVHRVSDDPTALQDVVAYADGSTMALVAVLNDDTATTPAWRDYRVSLSLTPTEEWTAWCHGQDLGPQQRFAERIEDGLREIVDPSGAEMLELAQTLHVNVGVKCKSGHRLANGETQFTYEEDVQASAGKTGTLTIPNEFTLGIAPFIGTEPYEVKARLRFKPPRGGELQIGYILDRPHDVERAAFADIVTRVRSAKDMQTVRFINGPAPEPASRS